MARLLPRRGPRPASWLGALILVAVLAAPGCKDQRGDVVQPSTGTLDGGTFYASALVATMFQQGMNDITERVLEILDSGQPTPVFEIPCQGDGLLAISLNATRTVATLTFDNFVIGCTDPLALTLNGQAFLEFVETSPGLVYRLRMNFNHCEGASEGLIVQLPNEQGGFIFDASTPGDLFAVDCLGLGGTPDPYGPGNYLECALVGPRTAGGPLSIAGTLRLEDDSGFLLVYELDYVYGYNESVDPVFSDWPSGSYEVASFGSPGGLTGAGGGVPGYPVDVTFDGFGGATFDYQGRVCRTNLRTGENPCEGL